MARHMHLFGTTREQVAYVTSRNRSYGVNNPLAQFRKPISVEEVAASSLIADPIRKFDCCPATDGAAAVVVAGAERAAELGLPGPDILGTRAALYPDSESVIGFDVGGTGFRIVLTAAVSATIDANIAEDVDGLLADHAVSRGEVDAWIAHPGGPRVLEAFEKGLSLTRDDLSASWASLDAVGNLSSSSVLHVLSDMLVQPAGTHGVLFALGPGVTSEYVLLRWAA